MVGNLRSCQGHVNGSEYLFCHHPVASPHALLAGCECSVQEKSASLGASVELVIDLLKRAMKDPDATDKTREFGQILLDTLQDGVAQRAEEAPRSVRVAKKEVFAVPAFTAAVDA